MKGIEVGTFPTRALAEATAALLLADFEGFVLTLRVDDLGVWHLIDETPAEVFA